MCSGGGERWVRGQGSLVANRPIRFGKRYKLIKPHAANNANSIAVRDKSNWPRSMLCCWPIAVCRLKGCRQQCQLSAICTASRCCCRSFGNRSGNRLIVEAIADASPRLASPPLLSSPLPLPRISLHNTHTHYPEQPTTHDDTAPSSLSASSLLERRQLATCCTVAGAAFGVWQQHLTFVYRASTKCCCQALLLTRLPQKLVLELVLATTAAHFGRPRTVSFATAAATHVGHFTRYLQLVGCARELLPLDVCCCCSCMLSLRSIT